MTGSTEDPVPRTPVQPIGTVAREDHAATHSAGWVSDVAVLILEGEVDARSMAELHEQLMVVGRPGLDRVLVDMGAVTMLAGPALIRFCVEARALSRTGIALDVVGAPHPVRRTLELCAIPGVEFPPNITAALRPASGAVRCCFADLGGVSRPAPPR